MSNQIVPDGVILSMSPARLLASLSVMFSVNDEDFSDHPQFREMTTINPVVYPDYIRHALVTSLHEQGVQFSPTMMRWLQPLSITACRAYNVATLWGNNPEYELKIAASRLFYCPRSKQLDFILNAFLRCRLEYSLDAVALLPPGHPDIEAARLAVLTEVELSGIPRVNDWSEQEEE